MIFPDYNCLEFVRSYMLISHCNDGNACCAASAWLPNISRSTATRLAQSSSTHGVIRN